LKTAWTTFARSRRSLTAAAALFVVFCFLSATFVRADQPSSSLAASYIEEAKSLFQNNNLAGAIQSAKQACEIDPSSPESFKWLGFFLTKQSKKEEAVQALARAVELGEKSGYSEDLLDSLLHSGPFPAWLDPRSLPYLPATLESFHFDLSDFRLPQSSLKGFDGVFTTSLVYPPTVPMPGPGDLGQFNRVCYVFRLDQDSLRYELYIRLAYGSPLLWNLDTDMAPAIRSIVTAASSFFLYAQAYLPEDAFPVLRYPLNFWLYPTPGKDSWNKDGVFLYGVTSPQDDIGWFKRLYGLLGQNLLFAGGPSLPSFDGQEACANLVGLWSLLNSRPGPTALPAPLVALQEGALTSLNQFLLNFSPEALASLPDGELSQGAFLYLCAASPPDTMLATLSSFSSQGSWDLSRLAQPPALFARFVLDPLLRFSSVPLQSQDFFGRDEESGLALLPGSANQYWLSLPEGRWRIDFVAKAGSQSALVASLDGNPLAKAPVPQPEWKRFRTQAQIVQPGWHRLEISVPEDAQPLHLKSLELRLVE